MIATQPTKKKWTPARFKKAWAANDAKHERVRAVICDKSGWTQTEIAKEVGLGQQYIGRLLKFGAFLNFTPTGVKRNIPPNFREGEFRRHWDQTDNSRKDAPRFQTIYKRLANVTMQRPQENSGQQIKKLFADGKHHTTAQIIEGTGLGVVQVERALERMEKASANGVLCRSERWRGERRWKLRKLDGRAREVRSLPTNLSEAQGRILEAQEALQHLLPLLDLHPAIFSPTSAIGVYRQVMGILQGGVPARLESK